MRPHLRNIRTSVIGITAFIAVIAIAAVVAIVVALGHSDPGPQLFVDPQTDAAQQVAQWQASGQVKDAQALKAIADQPTAYWPTDKSGLVTKDVDGIVTRAANEHQLATLVAYGIPHRDCGSYSGGGANDAATYRRYLGDFATGINHRPVIVVVEPDAVAQTFNQDCKFTQSQVDERFGLLAEAVHTFKATGHAQVCLDAGNPGWVTDLDALAASLQRAGIGTADCFALNVSNFYTTKENIDYGTRLSGLLGGKRFVIDTSRNGRGTYVATTKGGSPNWCNPPGRAIGDRPQLNPGPPLVAGYLWVKTPGDSDGTCGAGAPVAGQFWPNYALGLARNAAS